MKKVLITGSTRGLGLELAKAFIAIGDEVYTHSTGASKDIGQKKHIGADFSTKEGVSIFAKNIKKIKPDILINNAAVYETGINHMAINAMAPAYFISKYLEYMKQGRIININSIAGIKPNVDEWNYCASKAALKMYSECVKQEALKNGIQIVDIYSGAINVGMSTNRKDKNKLIDAKELAQFIVSLTSLKTLVPNEIIVQRTMYC